MKAAVVVCLLLLAVPARADLFPTQERGFQAGKAFASGDFDSVNLFNGNLLLTIGIGGSYPVGGGLSYGLTLVYNSNAWNFQLDAIGAYTQAVPSKVSNAGLGWRLSLGELLDPTDPDNETGSWLWIAPDGGEHRFVDTLHEGEPVVAGVGYTRDGSYLRLRSPATDKRMVELPDGLMQTFTRSGAFGWRLTRIEDHPGNWLTVSYTLDTSGAVKSWTVQDQHGRTQTVNFVVASHYGRVVGNVVLSTFGGGTATYTFNYTSVNLPSACPNTDPQTASYQVPLLTSVVLPDGSSWSMPASDYYLDATAGCRLPGVLKAITTPTLSRYEWAYGAYGFPVESDEKPWRNLSHGVYKRTVKNAAGVVEGVWTYTPSLNPTPGPTTPGREAVRTVITPLGDKTESYFSVALDLSDEGWSQRDYGLPFTRFVTDGGSQFLSIRTWDCDAGAVNCVLKRSTYVAYQRDEGPLNFEMQINLDRNRRVSATRAIYEDDSQIYEAAVSSQFDGLGHYRQTDLSGTFDAGNSATEFTNYNAGRGTYPGSFVMLGANDPWILGTYTEQTRTEGTSTAKTESCFEASTGLLLRTRVLQNGTSQGTSDVVTKLTYTGGNPTREEFFGGDVQALSTGALCSLALPANQYRIDHGWQYGAHSTAQYVDASGLALSFKSLDTDIDLNTGLVKTSRDTSGISTSYEYDSLGRLTAIKPETGHDGQMQYVYSRALDATTLAQVQVLRTSNDGEATLAESVVKYDSLGRISQEQIRMPDGALSTKETLYNALGWKASVSEQGNTSKKTEYQSYDPFGRPGTVRPPDGSSHDVTFSYTGVRKVSRTSKVGNSYSSGVITEVLSTTQEIYDRQGRLYQVREQADTNGTDTITTYSYDIGNRLSRVKQETSAGTQNRWFTYDNRGFLTSEQHPEKGTSGNGSVAYSNYDARGHARNKVDGPHSLAFTYDRAERLTQVNGNGGQLLEAFTFGSSNAVGSRTNGRLETSTRYNYIGSPFNATVAVTETWAYGGRQGRPSGRTTQMFYNGTASESFTQSWTWTALGDLGSISYPICAFSGCAPAPRTIGASYTNGFLTAVPGWASAITYHGNGMVNQVIHGNGVVDTQANDPNMMGRPSQISSAKGATTLWSTGSYAYDGSGNVVKNGNGYYLYDRVSRLIEGRVYLGSTGGGVQKWQTYTYDPFGNIQSIGGTSGRSTPTSSSTNRLSGTGTVYDSAGNLTNWNGNTYEYDRFNQMTRMLSGTEDWRYIYTAGGERFWSYRVGGGGSLWALRDLDGRLLREYEAHTSWSTVKDYLYRGTQLLASIHPAEGAKHFHLDHLGTPRLVTTGGTGGDFYTLTPCRVLDTRSPYAPLAAGETRSVTLTGACGVPANATAVAVNLTVVDASAQGELTAYPANEPRPVASAISYPATNARANNGILKLGNGALAFFNNQASGGANLLIDVNGYFVEDAGAVVAYHVYYPFGEEATAFNLDTEQMKFTGHERDLASLAGAGDDLDYMHARHCSPFTGRFLSVDPAGESFNPKAPQSWNRYSYVQGHSLSSTDPTGETLELLGLRLAKDMLEDLANKGLHGYDLEIDDNGVASLQPNGEVGPASPEQSELASTFRSLIDGKDVVTIKLTVGSTQTLMGNYSRQEIDIQDISAMGTTGGMGPNAFSTLGHELAEQGAKQRLGFRNSDESFSDYLTAHNDYGVPAQNAISGFKLLGVDKVNMDERGSGLRHSILSRGARTIIVTIYSLNNNVIRVEK